MTVSSCALMVSVLWISSVVEASVVLEYFEAMQYILNYSASGLYLSKEGYGFSVTK